MKIRRVRRDAGQRCAEANSQLQLDLCSPVWAWQHTPSPTGRRAHAIVTHTRHRECDNGPAAGPVLQLIAHTSVSMSVKLKAVKQKVSAETVGSVGGCVQDPAEPRSPHQHPADATAHQCRVCTYATVVGRRHVTGSGASSPPGVRAGAPAPFAIAHACMCHCESSRRGYCDP